MDDRYVIRDLAGALRRRERPTATVFNRLEGRPRTRAFDRTLRAEVRDPLWMLTRQWQLGEFRGDDAASPVFARLRVDTAPLDGVRAADQAARSADDAVPLEALVEQRPVPMQTAGQRIGLDIRLLLGRRWLQLVAAVGDYADEFIGAFGVPRPDPTGSADAAICAHPRVWQQVAAVAGEAMDGYELYRAWRANPATALDDVDLLPQHVGPVRTLAERFAAWFEGLLLQPGAGEDAWRPDALEYRFACSVPQGPEHTVLTAEAYHHGHLDWYSVDVDPDRGSLDDDGGGPPPAPPEPVVRALVPGPVVFTGMPNTRWWAFEDRRTNFGDVRADTTDLGRLLVLEFGLVYANDWFLVPLTLPAGALAEVRGLVVTDVFGERIWIEPAGSGAESDWERWSMFALAAISAAPSPDTARADTRLLVLPTAPRGQSGPPLEEVLLIRDEMANMVWGVETRVPLPDGRATGGAEAADDTRRFHEGPADGQPTSAAPEPAAPIRYRVMTTVPEHWIPFVPTHVPGSSADVRLQRGALPRIVEGGPDPAPLVRPRTSLLSAGLEAGEAYYVNEQEVPRAGAQVSQAFQRCRWYGGAAVVWLGASKRSGRGEGSSGLAFDQLVPTE